MRHVQRLSVWGKDIFIFIYHTICWQFWFGFNLEIMEENSNANVLDCM